jgi:hypothetical protein
MPGFVVRVELHGAAPMDYQKLHHAMTEAGFDYRVTGTDGVNYRLPTAEYYIEIQSTPEMARWRAANAAAVTGKGFSVLVTPVGGLLYWQNLQRV